MLAKKIQKKLEFLPQKPGVYIFKGKKNSVLYIGKAVNLKSRVRSYFTSAGKKQYRCSELIKNSTDLDWFITPTEVEALILEDQMIKREKPKYNIQLKDSKSYPYIKVTVNEMFSRMLITREIVDDGSLYFGPFSDIKSTRETVNIIQKQFPLRLSKMKLDGSKVYKPCLNYQLNRCLAPCTGQIKVTKYQKLVSSVLKILMGNSEILIQELNMEIQKQSEALNFEEAARIRDSIFAIRKTIKKQIIISQNKINRDVLGLLRSNGSAGVQVLFYKKWNFVW